MYINNQALEQINYTPVHTGIMYTIGENDIECPYLITVNTISKPWACMGDMYIYIMQKACLFSWAFLNVSI